VAAGGSKITFSKAGKRRFLRRKILFSKQENDIFQARKQFQAGSS